MVEAYLWKRSRSARGTRPARPGEAPNPQVGWLLPCRRPYPRRRPTGLYRWPDFAPRSIGGNLLSVFHLKLPRSCLHPCTSVLHCLPATRSGPAERYARECTVNVAPDSAKMRGATCGRFDCAESAGGLAYSRSRLAKRATNFLTWPPLNSTVNFRLSPTPSRSVILPLPNS